MAYNFYFLCFETLFNKRSNRLFLIFLDSVPFQFFCKRMQRESIVIYHVFNFYILRKNDVGLDFSFCGINFLPLYSVKPFHCYADKKKS